MCVGKLFKQPTPPDPPPLPPAATPNPQVATVDPKERKLLDVDQIAKVDYGGTRPRPTKGSNRRVTADSLKINLGGTSTSSKSGGLNIG